MDGHDFPVSRFALASASEFFRGAFTSTMREGVDHAVALSGDLAPTSVEALLHFAHSSGTELWVNDEQLDETWSTADQVTRHPYYTHHLIRHTTPIRPPHHLRQLGFTGAARLLAGRMGESLAESNVLARLAIAERHGMATLVEASVSMISAHWDEIVKDPAFMGLSRDTFSTILSADQTGTVVVVR